MTRSVVQTLILSDWHRHRIQTLPSIAGGGIGIVLLQVGGEMPTIIGATWFFVALIVFGSMLPVSNVVNERKKQILPFLMSLPISVTQYTTAKIVSTVGMFLVSWLTLVVAGVFFIIGRQSIPDGIIPVTLILATLTFIPFSAGARPPALGPAARQSDQTHRPGRIAERPGADRTANPARSP